jgi:hypothetical protein
MKIRLRYVILISIIIIGSLTAIKMITTVLSTAVVNTSAETINQPYNLRVIKAVNILKRGEIGTITIQGRPGVRYTIIAAYSKGNKNLEGRQQRTADEFGQVTFIWTVAVETVPGTYLVTITGGGETIDLHHTVIE